MSKIFDKYIDMKVTNVCNYDDIKEKITFYASKSNSLFTHVLFASSFIIIFAIILSISFSFVIKSNTKLTSDQLNYIIQEDNSYLDYQTPSLVDLYFSSDSHIIYKGKIKNVNEYYGYIDNNNFSKLNIPPAQNITKAIYLKYFIQSDLTKNDIKINTEGIQIFDYIIANTYINNRQNTIIQFIDNNNEKQLFNNNNVILTTESNLKLNFSNIVVVNDNIVIDYVSNINKYQNKDEYLKLFKSAIIKKTDEIIYYDWSKIMMILSINNLIK